MMDRSPEQMRLLFDQAIHVQQGEAPWPVLEAAWSLLRPDERDPVVMCTAASRDGVISWYLVIQTARTIIYVESSRKAHIWSRDYGPDQNAYDHLVAWARPRSALSRVEVRSTATRFRDDSARDHSWTPSYALVFDDGYTLTLPIPETATSTQVEESVEDLVANLLDAF